MLELKDIVDLDRYSIQGLPADKASAFAAECRQRFVANGVLLLPEFLSRRGLENMAAYTQKTFYGRTA